MCACRRLLGILQLAGALYLSHRSAFVEAHYGICNVNNTFVHVLNAWQSGRPPRVEHHHTGHCNTSLAHGQIVQPVVPLHRQLTPCWCLRLLLRLTCLMSIETRVPATSSSVPFNSCPATINHVAKQASWYQQRQCQPH